MLTRPSVVLIDTVIASLLLLVVQFCFLDYMNQPLTHPDGAGFWAPAWSSFTSQNFIDPYTLSHVLHGIILYYITFPLWKRLSIPHLFLLVVGLEIFWEMLENTPLIINRYREETASLDYYGDSILNSIGDTVAAMVGFGIAYRFKWKISLLVFFLFEGIMLLTARDNLTLNILMLLYPIDAIKEWQLEWMPK